jgi:hypothetical protein
VASIKRTYNLSPETVRRVRELSMDYFVAPSQDAVVELAIDRLYRDSRELAEAAKWAAAAEDPQFRQEMSRLAAAYRDIETWPK